MARKELEVMPQQSRKTSSNANRANHSGNGSRKGNAKGSGGSGKKRKKKLTKKQRRKRKWILFGIEVLIIIILLAVLYFWGILSKINFKDQLSDTEAGINTDIDKDSLLNMEGYTNIAVFGLDNRSDGKYDSGNSDVIILASICNKTRDVKLVSVYRDTYLSVGDAKLKKANSAYGRGGVENAVRMLNTNLDLDIKKYVCVDWAAVVEVVDALGGIDIEVTDEELPYLNDHTNEVMAMTGVEVPYLKHSGLVTLNGTQAVGYSRIRYVGNDYQRTSRQRIVIQAMLTKAKQAGPGTLLEICNTVFPHISTSFKLTEIIDLASHVAEYNITETSGFPMELRTESIDGGDTIVPLELTNNVTSLHLMLFGEENYMPSDTVQTISNNIVKKTGLSAKNSEAYDMSKYNDTVNKTGTAQ